MIHFNCQIEWHEFDKRKLRFVICIHTKLHAFIVLFIQNCMNAYTNVHITFILFHQTHAILSGN